MGEMTIGDIFGNPATGEVFEKDDSKIKEYLGKALVEDLWNLRATQVYEARRLAQTDGRGVKVAIIDTGINYNHPQLRDSCSKERGINLSGESEEDFLDRNGHGTFVAGIIAGRDFGVAPGVEVYGVKVSDKGQIAIPQSIRSSMGIEKGDELVLIQIDDKVLLEKSQKVASKLKEDFKDILKFSEKSLKRVWDNKQDDIWNSYLKK